MKNELPLQPNKRKISDTAEHILNVLLMSNDLWTRFKGDAVAQEARYHALRTEQDDYDEREYRRAVAEKRYVPLFHPLYDQEVELWSDATIVNIASKRAENLVALSGTDQEDHSDIA